jgi:hypothetical protein
MKNRQPERAGITASELVSALSACAISYYLEHEDRVSDYLRRREEEAQKVRSAIGDRPRAEALRRRVRERYAQLKAKS